MLEYDRLTIRIDPAPGGGYDAYAEGSGGDGHGRFVLPFHERDLENFVLRMSRGSRRGRRRMETPETARAREFGRHLFESVFVGDVRDVYRMSLAEARRADRGLRITLQLAQVPELMDIPWEYLYDEPSFLSISAWTPVVRYLDLSRPRPPLAVKPPLRVLGMVSSPSDVEPLDVDEERARLERSLEPLCADGRVKIDWTEEASLSGLLRRLQRDTFHVFHYIGHGAYDTAADDGVILLEDRSGRSQQVSGSQLGTILCDHRSLRLAVLNACEGARSSSTDPFAGVASSLVQRELPAVIAMQFEITDEAAIVFSEFFYDALALGYSVDNALAHARQGVYASGNEVEWATPVLLLRVADGKLFDVDWQEAQTPEPHTSVDLKPPKEPELPPVLAPPPPPPEPAPEPELEPEPQFEPQLEPEPGPEPEPETEPSAPASPRRRQPILTPAMVPRAGVGPGRRALVELAIAAGAWLVAYVASFWVRSITLPNGDYPSHLSPERVKTVLFLALYWAVFTGLYVAATSIVARGGRLALGAAFAGVALGLVGGGVAGLVRYEVDSVVVGTAILGLGVGAARALGGGRAGWRAIVGGTIGGALAGCLLQYALHPGNHGLTRIDVQGLLCLLIVGGIVLAQLDWRQVFAGGQQHTAGVN
jgi:CHAT domain-containing protein